MWLCFPQRHTMTYSVSKYTVKYVQDDRHFKMQCFALQVPAKSSKDEAHPQDEVV